VLKSVFKAFAIYVDPNEVYALLHGNFTEYFNVTLVTILLVNLAFSAWTLCS